MSFMHCHDMFVETESLHGTPISCLNSHSGNMKCMLPHQACCAVSALRQLRIELWHTGRIQSQSDCNWWAEREFDMEMPVPELKLTALFGGKAFDLTI